jgi:hypothetical protein
VKVEVSSAVEELRRQFVGATVTADEDGQGGAIVFIEPIDLGTRFAPNATWFGFQIPAQYPYADIYPVFMAADVRRCDGVAFVAPVTNGHAFQNRPAIQISRRSAAAQAGTQTATAKILKVLDFLRNLQ